MRTLTDKDREILRTFNRILPVLSEREKDRLLWFGEGLAFKTEQQKMGQTS